MYNCEECPFCETSKNYDKNLAYYSYPYFLGLFSCSGRNNSALENHRREDICPAVLWSVVNASADHPFITSEAEYILKELTEGNQSELLCMLFQNAGPKLRKHLWNVMTEKFHENLYMFETSVTNEDPAKTNKKTVSVGQFMAIYKKRLNEYANSPAYTG